MSKTLDEFITAFGTLVDDIKYFEKKPENNIKVSYNLNQDVNRSASIQKEVNKGNNKMDFFDKLASRTEDEDTLEVTEFAKFNDKRGNHLLLASTGDYELFKNNNKVEAKSLNFRQRQDIREGNQAFVIADILNGFAEKTAETDYNETLNENIDPLRKNHEFDVAERELDSADAGRYKRKEPKGDKTLEEMNSVNHLGEQKGRTEDLLGSDGLYGRCNDEDVTVYEKLLEDARIGTLGGTLESELESVRHNKSNSASDVLAKTTLNILARTALNAGVSPEEVFDAVNNLSSKYELGDLILLASLGNDKRRKIASRIDLHTDSSNAFLNVESALLDEAGKFVGSLTSADLSEAIKIFAQHQDDSISAVTKIAKQLIQEKRVTAKTKLDNNKLSSRTSGIKGYLSLASGKHEDTKAGVEHIKTVLSSLINATQELKVNSKDVVDIFKGLDKESVAVKIASRMDDNESEIRDRKREANKLFDRTIVANKTNLEDVTFGWLADLTSTSGQPLAAIVNAIGYLSSKPSVLAKIITETIDLTKKAAVQVTDERITSIRINCTLSDLGNLDPKSSSFEEEAKNAFKEILSNAGYPTQDTITINSCTVSQDGNVTAEISSRFSTSYTVDGPNSSNNIGRDFHTNGLGIRSEETAPNVESFNENSQELVPEDAGVVITTDSAKMAKSNLASRLAQMPPMPMGGGSAGGEMGGMPPMGGGGSASDPSTGISGMTMPTAGEVGGEKPPTDADAMNEPGNKLPLGTICPRCGAKDVDISSGECHCNSCNLDYSVLVQINIKNPNEKDSADKKDETMPEPPPMGEEAGLGEATAPQPNPGGGMGMGEPAGAPPAMPMASGKHILRLAYEDDPENWVRMAQNNNKKDSISLYPVGQICPTCGDKDVNKVGKNTFCYNCAEVFTTNVKLSAKNPAKVIATIDMII